jgi:hypothetical protein
VARWRIEEDHQLAKQVAGLDSGQVIRWRSWHRWSVLCVLAYIYLAVAAALDRDAHAGLETGLIPVTIPEMLRMLRGTVIPPPRRDYAHRQHWSRWRRRHQYRAGHAHGAGMPTQMPHHDYNQRRAAVTLPASPA